MDRTINKCTAAYNEALLSGNMGGYKTLCYALRRAVKHRYKKRIESHFQLKDSRRMWQGLRTICAFGNKSSAEVRADPLLADELNTFYGRFECNGGSVTLPSSASGSRRQRSENHVITVSEDEVRRALKRVNIRKAAGPVLFILYRQTRTQSTFSLDDMFLFYFLPAPGHTPLKPHA